jgi:putative DNA primase/helicase
MQQVIDQLLEDGYAIGEFIPDAKIKRFALDDSDTKHSGWYVGYRNFVQSTGEEYFFVVYGSWKESEPKRYCTLGKKLPPSQAYSHKQQIKKAREQAEAAREIGYLEAAKDAETYFNGLALSVQQNRYLERKGIKDCPALGCRVSGENLVVPVRDIDGKIWSVEEVYPNGFKEARSGCRRKGGFHVIGQIVPDHRELTIYFAEGFATAASIYAATGAPTVCCFGTGGIRAIPKVFRQKYPSARLVVCGDRDKTGEESHKAAEEGAKVAGGSCLFPEFKSLEGQPTDFNDLHVAEGLEEVKRQLIGETALAPVKLSERDIFTIPFPHEDAKGSRLATIENLKELLRRLRIVVRYNGISKQREILVPDLVCTVDNRAVATRAYITSWCRRVGMPISDVGEYLEFLGDENLYNPVATYIESDKWDGKSRIGELVDTLHPKNKPLAQVLLRRWLISAVAAAYQPAGVQAHGVLVLRGAQYIGKTQWFRKLCAAELRADGILLRPDDKDSVLQVISRWLVELGELDATFRKSDIAQLKAFITKDQDIVRRPYAREESHYARRTVFLASVNEEQFLNDPTGNRRFWTIETEKIDYDHQVNMQQLWAEALELYRAGEGWTLNAEEMKLLNAENEQFMHVEPIEEMIATAFDWSDPRKTNLTATEVCQAIGMNHPSVKDTKVAGRVLKKLTGLSEPNKSGSRKTYPVPPKVIRAELLSIRRGSSD